MHIDDDQTLPINHGASVQDKGQPEPTLAIEPDATLPLVYREALATTDDQTLPLVDNHRHRNNEIDDDSTQPLVVIILFAEQ